MLLMARSEGLQGSLVVLAALGSVLLLTMLRAFRGGYRAKDGSCRINRQDVHTDRPR